MPSSSPSAASNKTREDLNRPPSPVEPGQPPEALGPTVGQNLIFALDDLTSAQNAFFSVVLNHLENRMILYRELGIMELDNCGMWIDKPLNEADWLTEEESPMPPGVPVEWMHEAGVELKDIQECVSQHDADARGDETDPAISLSNRGPIGRRQRRCCVSQQRHKHRVTPSWRMPRPSKPIASSGARSIRRLKNRRAWRAVGSADAPPLSPPPASAEPLREREPVVSTSVEIKGSSQDGTQVPSSGLIYVGNSRSIVTVFRSAAAGLNLPAKEARMKSRHVCRACSRPAPNFPPRRRNMLRRSMIDPRLFLWLLPPRKTKTARPSSPRCSRTRRPRPLPRLLGADGNCAAGHSW